MSLSSLQTLLSAAHKNMADLVLAQTCDVYSVATRAAAFSTLSCICRDPSQKEMALAVGYGLSFERVFEIAQQTNLSAANIALIRPKIYTVRFGGVDWEILTRLQDILDVVTAGASSPAVLVLGCNRLSGGVGEITGA